MSKILTSWKEIAQYFGKGVRTVQRWESTFGLPVRRPGSERHSAVLAIAEELDAWAMNRTETSASQLEILQSETIELREENGRLREENAGLRRRLAEPAMINLNRVAPPIPPRMIRRKGVNLST
jgi:hypothetical protein